MSLTPLLTASPVIQLHAYSAILALVLGAFVLFAPKGDARHRGLGRLWVGLMAVVALSSFFIWEIRMFGLFSPIHILSVVTLASLCIAVRYAMRHQIARHRKAMQWTYIGALVITGLFTFAPGRIMNRALFGEDGASWPELGLAMLALAGIAAGAWLVVRRRGRRLPA